MENEKKTLVCKIYKLSCNKTNKCYFGSTKDTINGRLSDHKHDYNRYLDEKYHYVTSFEILKHGDYKIELMEEMECDDKKIMHEKERYYIDNFECVNKYIPGRSKKEYMKEYNKMYYQLNKKK